MAVSLQADGEQIGSTYALMGIASLFMPGIVGIIADRWVNAERILGLLHLIAGGLLICIARTTDYSAFYTLMTLLCLCYMPTLGLTYTIAYSALNKARLDIVKTFPPIRVWGTVGFILAMWIVDLTGSGRSEMQFYISAIFAIILGVYSFTLPPCPPDRSTGHKNKSLLSTLGLDAFVLFKNRKMAVFFIFSVLLGACLQITNAFGNPFLDSFKAEYAESLAVKYPNILLSLSQISETLFILAIPFFLSKFGIKRVMLISILAWALRFGLFSIGNPGSGFIFLVLSMIVYGMAFDFFNISGSIFVDREVSPSIRASAQGLFIIMTNGLGAIIGSLASGWLVNYFTTAGVTDWPMVWGILAGYAVVIMILFALIFRYKEDPSNAQIPSSSH